MSSTTQNRTTIGQLVYRRLPPIDFAQLTADLEAALVGSDAGTIHTVEERPDLALIDVGASRIGVGIVHGLDHKGAAALIVSVGFGPSRLGDASLARRQSVLARLIAERITVRFPPQETLWTAGEDVASPELFDRLREELAIRRQAQVETQAERARARRSMPLGAVEPGDITRMFGRLEATLAARRSDQGQPAVSMAAAARVAPRGVAPAEEPPTTSAPMRLAAHLIDATLMVVALPVGAAMMIYGLTRGAKLNTSARALALSGAGIGILHGTAGIAPLGMLLL